MASNAIFVNKCHIDIKCLFDNVELMANRIKGLREKNKLATRSELSRFAIELFLKKGFANTTIDEIVEPLGIAKRTFFRYFSVKEDLVFAWYEDLTTDLVNELRSRPEQESPFEAVCKTLSSLLKMYDENPAWALSMARLSMETPLLIGKSFEKRVLWEKAFATTLVEREGKKMMSLFQAQIIAGVAMTAFTAAIGEWLAKEGKAKLRPIAERAFSVASAVCHTSR
jgi:AcrR family transcriptional regulator